MSSLFFLDIFWQFRIPSKLSGEMARICYAYPSFTTVKELFLNQQVFCVDKENIMYNSYTVFFVLSFFV
jgi:hypothetical protein